MVCSLLTPSLVSRSMYVSICICFYYLLKQEMRTTLSLNTGKTGKSVETSLCNLLKSSGRLEGSALLRPLESSLTFTKSLDESFGISLTFLYFSFLFCIMWVIRIHSYVRFPETNPRFSNSLGGILELSIWSYS